jgi:excisionase family DNA binding protein
MSSLSVKEAAERLGVSPALVYALCARKRIRHERHGFGRGIIRIPEEALEEYRKNCQVKTGEGAPAATLPLKHIKL